MRLRAFHGPAWCAASTAVVVALLGCSSGPDSGAPTGGSSGSASGGVPNSGGVPGSAGTSGAPSTGMGGSLAGGSAGSSGATSGGGPVGGAGMGGSSGAAGSVGSGGVGDPGSEGDGDFTITYPFPAAPEMTKRDGVPAGMVITFTVKSGASAIYPTDVRSGNAFDRVIHVYVPNGYVPGTEAPFMVVQDGSGYIERFMPLLDNMIADGRLPKMIGVFINPGPGDGPGSQRGLEYDRVSDHYVRFIESEILPKIATDYNLKFTTNPEGRASFGCSSGAAAAFTMGWFRPDLYRRILTYSGTFVNQHSDSMYPHGAWGYHETLIPNSEPKPLRVFLSVGSAESTANQPASSFRNWVLANQGMAAALKAKDYHYRFVYAEGGGHCDGAPIAQTLPEAMLWLWRGYPR